jgi:tripartite ATP-independent transporter DctM subunit
MIAIAIYVRVRPQAGGQSVKPEIGSRLGALIDTWPVAIVFLTVIGGIYRGWFTPTEGAAVGAAGTGLIAAIGGRLGWHGLVEAILDTATATAMIFFIVLGAAVFNSFLAFAQLPQFASEWVVSSGLSPWTVLAAILFCYLLFGCVMDSLSMILLTIPIFFPVVSALDFGLGPDEFAIWFGILVLIVVEVGLITPPVGLNLFVINALADDVPISQTYRGVLPFVASDLVRTLVLAAFPAITLFLVRLLY